MKLLKIVIAVALFASAGARADQIVTLKTRADVMQTYLLLADTDAKPQAVAVMFPGGQGQVRLPADISQLKLGPRGNFLVRSREQFRDRELAVAIVDSLDAALQHIRRYSTGHSETIVTYSQASAARFAAEIDAAAVLVNASSRFVDGGQFGFGAEIGISTQKLHARGPMGLPEMTSTKYVVTGSGQIRQ